MRPCIAAPAEDSVEAKAVQLAQLKAIGPQIAQLLANEVFYRDFKNRRQVGSCFGLTDTPYDSGASRRQQGISKAGNHRARTTAIEPAWLWLTHQPDSELSRWFRERVGNLKGRIRKIAIVALARKLMVALWRYLETGLVRPALRCAQASNERRCANDGRRDPGQTRDRTRAWVFEFRFRRWVPSLLGLTFTCMKDPGSGHHTRPDTS